MYSLDNDATRVVLTQPLHHSMILLLLSPWPSSGMDMQTCLSFCRLTLLGIGMRMGLKQ
jgi:hypothetical protein